MFEAKVIKNFTWNKRGDKLFKRKDVLNDLTEQEKDYLLQHGVIADVKEVGKKEEIKIVDKEEVIEHAVKAPKAEKAVKTKKVAKK